MHVNDFRHTIFLVVASAYDPQHHEGVSNLDDVIEAYNAISEAELRYRAVLRDALSSGVQQVAISKALNRTREMIRRDAMTEEQRDQMRRADAARKRGRRTTRKAS